MAKIDEIRDQYALTELSNSMAILTIDYVQEQIAKEVALGNTFLELSEQKWLYGKAHLEREWKRPLKEHCDQSLYERLQLAMPYKNCIFYVSYEGRIYARWGPTARIWRHFDERTPFYPCILFIISIGLIIVFILQWCGVFRYDPSRNISRS